MRRSITGSMHVALTALGLMLWATHAAAQVEVVWVGADPGNSNFDGDFNVADYWDHPSINGPFVPEGIYDEIAIINNGGTATVSGSVPVQGSLSVSNGTLAVGSGGSIQVAAVDTVDGNSDPTGVFTSGAATFGGNGVLSIANGGAFEAESLSLSGLLQQQITSTGLTAIQVGQSVNLGGNLEIDFSGFTPSSSGSWALIEANSVSGSFVDISAPGVTLQEGLFWGTRTVSVGGGREAAELFVDTQLVLEVDADSGGVATIKSPVAGFPVSIEGYRIRSAAGGLNPAGWNSLDDLDGPGNDDGGWRETPGTANQLAELNQDGASSIDDAGVSLGTIFMPGSPSAFREAVPGTDLVFDYTLADGSVRQGLVNINSSYVNDLVLTVDPTDGDVKLSNPSGFAVEIEAYEIKSSMDSLVPGGWTSLDDADGAGSNDGGWRETPGSSSYLAELNEDSTLAVSAAGKNLGSIYDFATDARDLVFTFLMAGETEPLMGTVLYQEFTPSAADLGDFNGDGLVNLADYTVWRDNLGGSASALNGNGSGSSVVTAADYEIWKDNFGADYTNGLSAVASSNVPEPNTALLVALVVGGYFAMQVVRPKRGRATI
ncbi:hypothetical protein [Aeoliella mucimassa]|uniref:PEP-CTERM protein-sorting domain-containing protein n=1 Tax=Aeoliella mucimassa TaxID=2527972 RepID=A0A518AK40_9BACT|nr:hypothetical protein [Aeoliella mucimassa]QDU55044.1 hypothetical protein Pan181_12300 [Aeoliella mucimassa]